MSLGARTARWLAPALLALAVLAVYGPTLATPLLWDDAALVEHMRATFQSQGVWGLITSDWGYLDDTPLGYWRPVTMLAMWLPDAISPSPLMFHATSLLLYFAGVLALWLLARALLASGAAALLTALFFALLPTHSESVCSVANRHDLLAGLFLTLAAWTWARDRGGSGGRPLCSAPSSS